MTTIRLRPITPKAKMNLKGFEREWVRVVERELVEYERLFRKVSDGFTSKNRPRYKRKIFRGTVRLGAGGRVNYV